MTTRHGTLLHLTGSGDDPALLDRQSELPRSVPLFRYAPQRAPFSWRGWDPALVRSASDLPQYLILGNLDHSTFELSDAGWSARWPGTEDDTHFDVAYAADEKRWRVRQTWCGLDGGFSFYSTRIPLDYPVAVEARLIFQALNYVEGKAPAWTTEEAVAFNQSMIGTGLAPHGFPVRETASDGSTAWTLRRDAYFLFITLPFAGLTAFMNRMATGNGPIRRSESHPELRFELRPVIMPATLEVQTESIAIWDPARTTRSFLPFAPLGGEKTFPTVEQVIENERIAPATLARIEAISSEVVAAIEQIFRRVMKRVSS